MMKNFLFSVIIILVSTSAALAADAGRLIKQGNRAFREQKYEDALKAYAGALSSLPDSPVANFNAGAARYKTGDYGEAALSFEKALGAEDRKLEAAANYNLGNARYMLGVSKEDSAVAEAVGLLESALANYERSAELSPKDEDVKVNRRIAGEKLAELRKKLQRQKSQCDLGQKEHQDQDKEEADKDKGQGQRTGQEEQGEREQQGQEQEQSGQEQEPGEQRAQGAREDQREERSEDSAGSEQAREMSREEADMLLEAFGREERSSGRLNDGRKSVEDKVEKDW